jgi:flavin reductase
MAKPTLLSKDEPIVQAFRASMRGCASTVTAVSTAEGAHRFCMVATAMMSVSIDPPSVVVAINKTASIHDPLVRRGFFCVNVIGSEQEHLARELSIRAGEDRLEVGGWENFSGDNPALTGLPYLTNVQSYLMCRTEHRVEFGTHSLFIGTVEDAIINNANSPLVYCDGTYGRFGRDNLNR